MPGAITDRSETENGTAAHPRATTLLSSFGYAWQGIRHALITQRNFKIHAVAAVIAIAMGVVLSIGLLEWAALAIVIGLVFQTELVNTAIEAIVDKVSPEYHDLAKIAKDCGAAAVLVSAIAAVGVGLAVFGPRLLAIVRATVLLAR